MTLRKMLRYLRSRNIYLARLILTLFLMNAVVNEAGIWTAIAIALPLLLAELHLVRIRIILEQMLQDGQIEDQ